MLEFLIFAIIIAVVLLKVSQLTRRWSGRRKRHTTVYSEPTSNIPAPPSDKEQRKSEVILGRAYITDGDSLKIKMREIRLFGIDAPELNHPYGKQAKWALHTLCKGQLINAEIICNDNHGRFVARCLLEDGRDLSAEMVKLGLAIDWPKFSGGQYRVLEAPDARKKMWLADARQKGRMHVWAQFEARKNEKNRSH